MNAAYQGEPEALECSSHVGQEEVIERVALQFPDDLGGLLTAAVQTTRHVGELADGLVKFGFAGNGADEAAGRCGAGAVSDNALEQAVVFQVGELLQAVRLDAAIDGHAVDGDVNAVALDAHDRVWTRFVGLQVVSSL